MAAMTVRQIHIRVHWQQTSECIPSCHQRQEVVSLIPLCCPCHQETLVRGMLCAKINPVVREEIDEKRKNGKYNYTQMKYSQLKWGRNARKNTQTEMLSHFSLFIISSSYHVVIHILSVHSNGPTLCVSMCAEQPGSDTAFLYFRSCCAQC